MNSVIIKLPTGRCQARIRDTLGRHLSSKTFDRKGDAQTSIRRVRSDAQERAALGSEHATLTLGDTVDNHLADWRGRDTTHRSRVLRWKAGLGHLGIHLGPAAPACDSRARDRDGLITRYRRAGSAGRHSRRQPAAAPMPRFPSGTCRHDR